MAYLALQIETSSEVTLNVPRGVESIKAYDRMGAEFGEVGTGVEWKLLHNIIMVHRLVHSSDMNDFHVVLKLI
jgi:hypothetical protein